MSQADFLSYPTSFPECAHGKGDECDQCLLDTIATMGGFTKAEIDKAMGETFKVKQYEDIERAQVVFSGTVRIRNRVVASKVTMSEQDDTEAMMKVVHEMLRTKLREFLSSWDGSPP